MEINALTLTVKSKFHKTNLYFPIFNVNTIAKPPKNFNIHLTVKPGKGYTVIVP